MHLDSLVPSRHPEVRGVVRARHSQQPVPFARVTLDTAETVTDSAGRFHLRRRAGARQLRVLALGYKGHLVPLPAGRRGTQWITMDLARSCRSLAPMKLATGAPATRRVSVRHARAARRGAP